MKRITFLLAFFVFVGLQGLLAQNLQISGKVTSSDDGLPLPGVSVVVKGTLIGTVTDVRGDYQISVPGNATTLVFSFIGMKSQEIALAGQSIINIVMDTDALSISEVVVVGLGLKPQEKTLGYSATIVKSESFERSSQIDAMNSLQGKVAGVEVTSGGGMPGASTKVVIRGYSSLAANNPLYVVDGTPIDNSFRTGSGNNVTGLDFGNRANDINPNDIESMSILKGAAATAQYGSRAANGVIMITTKKGKNSDKMMIELNSSVSVSDVLRIPQFQNTFGQGWSGHWAVDENGSWGPEMDGNIRAWGNVYNGSQKIKKFSPVKDNLYDFYDYGMQYNNSVSMLGGNDKTIYRISYNNVKGDGTIPGDIDINNKNEVSLNASNISRKLTSTTTIHYVNRTGSLNPDGYGGSNAAANVYSELLQIPRDFSVVDFKNYKTDPFNNLDNFYTPYAFNPYFAINENVSKFFENRVYGNLQLDYEFFDWFKATWRLGADVSSFNRKGWEAIMQFTPGSPQFEKAVTPNPGNVYEENRTTQEINADWILQFDKNITSDISLEGVLGYNVNQRYYKGQNAEIFSLVIPEFYNLGNTDGRKDGSTYESKKRQFAYFGSAVVGFREFAYLNLSARQEYSSTLPKEANSYFYPAVSVSLLAHEIIPGLKDNNNVNLIKLRASYGLAGNDAPVYYIYPYFQTAIVTIPFSSLDFPLAGVGAFEKGNQIGNLNLKPEITTEKEIGADIRLFNSRLMLDLALYNRVSDGQILSVDLAPSSGFATQIVNFAEVENKGIELAATLVPVQTRNFEWAISGTYTKNKNKVIDLPGGEQVLRQYSNYGIDIAAVSNQPIGMLRTPDFERDDEGHVIVNGSSGIPIAGTEYTEAGNVLPKFVFGLLNSFKIYKDIQFSFLIDWRKGGYLWSGTADLHYFTGNATQTTYNNRQPFIVPNSVKENPFYVSETETPDEPLYVENDIPITMVNINAYYYHTNNQRAVRDRIIPRDYLKLRDVSLSYNIPQNITSKLRIEKAMIILSGRNLLLFTPKENNFIDPESTSYGNDLVSEFGEFRTGPTVRSFTASIRINF